MVTRVRLEASAIAEDAVKDDLVKAAKEMKALFGGSWHSDPDTLPEIQTTATGYWGRLTLVRVTMQ